MDTEGRTYKKEREIETRLLPKNFRQVGDPGNKKIYMEDYVYTYLNKLAQPGNAEARGAILFGNVYQTAVGNCLFISGATACQFFEFDLDDVSFTEERWKEIEKVRAEFFHDMEVVGWFLSRMGFSVDLNDKLIQLHMDNFSGENKVLYMIDSLENEDAFYQLDNYVLKKQRGYYLYYEANQEMKNYMLFEAESSGETESRQKVKTIRRDAMVMNNYRKTLQKKKEEEEKAKKKLRPFSLASALVVAIVMAYGVRSVIQYQQGGVSADSQETMAQGANGTGDISGTYSENNDMDDPNNNGMVAVGSSEEDAEATSETAETDDMIADGADGDELSGNEQIARFKLQNGDASAESDQESFYSIDDVESGEDTAQAEETDVDVSDETDLENVEADSTFTQEEPDDVQETWSYIGGSYEVLPGDTLASISKKIYESYDYVGKIAEVNNLEDMNKIWPGQVLKMPEMED